MKSLTNWVKYGCVSCFLGMLSYSPLLADTTTEIAQHGITWTFAAPVEFGQFVNGDYYVVAPSGGAVVASVSPASAGGRNGSMVNPNTEPKQAYDSRLPYYETSELVSYPATLSGGSSLVSTISFQDTDQVNGRYVSSWTSATVSSSFAKLKTAAVLTILPTAPPANSFRPPYIGADKPIFNTSQIQSSLLPAVEAPSNAPPSPVSYYERGLARPWLTHLPGWQCRYLHPVENMLNYHREIGKFWSDASLLITTELATPTLVNNYIQTGIDQYFMAKSGTGDSAFFEVPVILTGILLGDDNIANMFVNSENLTTGRATQKFYYWEDKQSTIVSSIVPAGETWTGATVFFKKQSGNTEHEHLHPSEWDLVANGGGRKQETYRHCCDSIPHMGMALASRMLGASENRWPDKRLDDYLERWMTEDWSGTWKPIAAQYHGGIPDSARSMGSTFANEMWVLYEDYLMGTNPRAATPTMDPPPGSYLQEQSVALASLTPGATIRYTEDGSIPDLNSTVYSGPILINGNTVIRAMASSTGLLDSGISLGSYLIGQSPVWISSSEEWGNAPIVPQSQDFVVTFKMTPGFDDMDGVFGLSDLEANGNPDGYSALATTIRLNETGVFDARDGSVYRADKVCPYDFGGSYSVVMSVDMVAKTYDVVVEGIKIADDYAFRTGTTAVSQLDNIGYFSSFDETFFTVEDFMIENSLVPPPPPFNLRIIPN